MILRCICGLGTATQPWSLTNLKQGVEIEAAWAGEEHSTTNSVFCSNTSLAAAAAICCLQVCNCSIVSSTSCDCQSITGIDDIIDLILHFCLAWGKCVLGILSGEPLLVTTLSACTACTMGVSQKNTSCSFEFYQLSRHSTRSNEPT